MKIEIGESLIFSWLRHVMGCPIAQANWKPSPTWPIRREPGLASDFEKMSEIAGQRLGFEIFKKSSFQQFIRQAEIDVLGLRFDGPYCHRRRFGIPRGWCQLWRGNGWSHPQKADPHGIRPRSLF